MDYIKQTETRLNEMKDVLSPDAILVTTSLLAVATELRASRLSVYHDSVIIPLIAIGSDEYELTKEIMVVVEKKDEDNYIASFYDANVNASGDTQKEAFDNLKDMLLSKFDVLTKTEKKLSTSLKRQLDILSQFLRKKNG